MTAELHEQQMYDRIMGSIEPDLLSSVIDAADEKREGETDEDFEIRLERYAFAFDQFDQICDLSQEILTEDLKRWEKKMRDKVEGEQATEDAQVLKNIDDEINSSDQN